jgi:hypothetical protein
VYLSASVDALCWRVWARATDKQIVDVVWALNLIVMMMMRPIYLFNNMIIHLKFF